MKSKSLGAAGSVENVAERLPGFVFPADGPIKRRA
jgi:hypothetical protein